MCLSCVVCCTISNHHHICPSGISSVLPDNGGSGFGVPCMFTYPSQGSCVAASIAPELVDCLYEGPACYSVSFYMFFNLLISTACLLPRTSARYQGYILKLLKLTAAPYGGDSQGLSHRQGIKCINTYKEAR